MKLYTLSVVIPACLVIAFLIAYYKKAHDDAEKAYVQEARSVLLTVEGARKNAEEMWEKKVFTIEQARKFADVGDRESLLAMIPIITAIKTAKVNASEAGYEVRVPKNSPRNTKNAPQGVEIDILREFEEDRSKKIEERVVIDKQMNAVRYFRPIELSERCMYCHGEPSKSKEYWGNTEGKDATGTRMEGWKVGERHGAFEVIMPLAKVDKMVANTMTNAGIFALIGFGVLVGLSAFAVSMILKPVKESLLTLESMSAGDFTHACTVDQTDEIGQMAKAVERVRETFRGIVGELRMNVNNLDVASNSLKVTSKELEVNANVMTEQSNSVAQAGEELSANTDQLAISAREITSSANTVAAGIEEMSASINEVAKNCAQESQIAHQANEKSRENRRLITELGAAAQEIDKVLDLISNIASQTNLLALNATIEAASAGEAGKGFAVVASEVKQLSRQTADATKQIAEQINAIQSKTRLTVDANNEIAKIIEEISTIAQSIAAAVEEQSATSHEISKTMQTVSSATQHIARSIEESAIGVRQVSQSAHKVSSSAENSSAGARETSDSANKLEVMSKRLAEIVNQFKI